LHPLFQKADSWTEKVIGAAIEVHRLKGPGLLEPLYEKFMMRECLIQKIPVVQQLQVKIEYKGYIFEEPLRVDLLVDDCLIIELKAVAAVLPVHKAQLMSYMKLLNKPIGLLINFHEVVLKNGISRLILPGANQ
jgi:GxxExxY protein